MAVGLRAPMWTSSLRGGAPARCPSPPGHGVGRRPHRFVGLLGIFALVGMASLTTVPSAAQDIRLEAEAFIDSQDNGLEPITIVPCNLASGGYAVDGVDATGDRIVLDLPLDLGFCFQCAIRSAGDVSLIRTFEVSFHMVPDGTLLFADTLTTIPGSGIG